MASPQVEDGHIDIANTIADKFCSYRLSGQEWQILWVVIRKTWGWLENSKLKNGKKKKMDAISLSQFSELTGIDRHKCHAIIKKLVTKKILIKGVPQKVNSKVISYGFQKDFDLWGCSPKGQQVKKQGVPQKVNKGVPQKVNKGVPQKVNHKRYIKEKKDTPTKISNFVGQFSDYIISEKKNKAPKKTQTLIENSIDTVDKLIRIDGFELEYIKKVCRWAIKDEFWGPIFFSLAPLRKKSDNGASKFVNMATKHDKENGNWAGTRAKKTTPAEQQQKFEEVFK